MQLVQLPETSIILIVSYLPNHFNLQITCKSLCSIISQYSKMQLLLQHNMHYNKFIDDTPELLTPILYNTLIPFQSTELFQLICRCISYNWNWQISPQKQPYRLCKIYTYEFITKINNYYQCNICGAHFINKKFVNLHMEQTHYCLHTLDTRDAYCSNKQCMFCKKKFKRLTQHSHKMHWKQIIPLLKVNVAQEKNFTYRKLNASEIALFHVLHNKHPHINECNVAINSAYIFIQKLDLLYHYSKWKDIIFQKQFQFILAGGSVLHCLRKYNVQTTIGDLDFFALHMTYEEYKSAINILLNKLHAKGFQFTVKKSSPIIINVYINFLNENNNINIQLNQNEFEKWTKFQFIWMNKMNPSMLLTIIFDLEPCQVAFDGLSLFSTYAFIQSITTNTMINYKYAINQELVCLHERRNIKYINKGFVLLTPKKLSYFLQIRYYNFETNFVVLTLLL